MAIFVEEAGHPDAPVVVLLHGAGTSGWMWSKQIPALAADFRVLTPDLPGHGRSNTHPWVSIADTARLVAEIVSSRAPDGKAHVVGLSLGGYIAAHLAATMPGHLHGAVVSGVNVLPFPHPRRMRIIGRMMEPVIAWGPVVRANARTLAVPPDQFDGYRDAVRAMTRQAFRKVNEEALEFRLPEQAAASPCPILAVAGAGEHELIRRSLTEIATAFPAGEARLVPGAGHGWNGERPELFTAMVRSRVLGEPLPDELQPV
ncbi:alpha/beta hydrolase [Planotetraspora thailandica]|uniref:Alpha/beta hydrolase n=1 Tax=Planotetraspora thailandica TaxID=487172 RepID=A0A8J3Y1D8_9ACTN|nr:alpha/beta fold hydrolase [Planotetraspora thailandica]GII58986.1 alpha/beta hydrolase [Planotetraspora thailandica]